MLSPDATALAALSATSSAAYLAATVDALPDGIIIYDAQGRVLLRNEAIRHMLGFAADPDFDQRPFAQRITLFPVFDMVGARIPPEDLPAVRALRGETILQDAPMYLHVVTLDQRQIEVLVSAAPVWGDGRISGAVTVYHEVTAQRAVEADRAALAQETDEQQRQLRLLEAVSAIGLATRDLDALLARILDAVQGALSLDNATVLLVDPSQPTEMIVRRALGVEEAVAASVRVPIGRGFAGTIAATRAPLVVDDMQTFPVVTSVLRDKIASSAGVPLIADDVLLGVLHVGSATPRHFTEGEVRLLRIVGDRVALIVARALADEAERQARAAAQASAALSGAILAQAAVGIARVGLDGHWLEVNDALCAITGYSRAQLLALTFQDITYPDDLDADLALAEQLLAGEIPTYTLEKRYLHPDGHYFWINLSVALVRRTDGTPNFFISVIEDISARKAAEAEVRALNQSLERRVAERTEQLQEANADLEAFGYSVSHDLRAPLRAMQGFAQALREDYAHALDDEAQHYLMRIVAAAGTMDTLIQDLLAYARLSRADLRPVPVSLAGVVDEARGQLEAEIAARGAQITVDLPLPVVLGHRATLVQVVVNVLSNALRFVPAGQSPVVHLWAEVRHQAGGRWVRLWVADEGIGIAPEHQERIFRVFERLHGTEQYPGTGIGLAIVRKGMERLGGRAGVVSAEGQGSQVWIELPEAPDA